MKFPDGWVLEGSFGGRETIGSVHEFVRERVMDSERKFYLFETPPKRVVKEMGKSLFHSKLVPSCLLYFAWTEGESPASGGPYLNLPALKEFISAY